ncbi:SGNH/GDSL hydrolase family protein [Rhodoblastus sp.]|uniref:SGNH/GDSL hydrolase family protein n=1 Tax=Rhodoblastus sp. TaxID=1962975 RepID=UPI003F9551E4
MQRPLVLFAAALAVGAAPPLFFPASRTARPVRVASENLCRGAAFAPARIGFFPHFSKAISDEGRVRIVAIGSSSTEGVGASAPAENYPSQLRDMLERALPAEAVEVVNLGIGGETAAETVVRLREEIPRLEPDLVLWQVGANDGIDGVPPKQYEAIVRAALRFLKGGEADVLLVGMQWTRKLAANPNYMAIQGVTARVAREEGVPLVSRYDAMRLFARATGREDFTGPDDLHLNDKGYRCLAEQIAATLSRATERKIAGRT